MLPALAIFSWLADATGFMPGVGHMGHLGGMAYGALYFLLVLRKRPFQFGGHVLRGPGLGSANDAWVRLWAGATGRG